MFKELIKKERVLFADHFDCWEDAIRAAAQPLLRDEAINESYITDMIENVNKFGPYIVIAPDVAMPHAQGGKGVNETAISFMRVKQPVKFSASSEHNARLLFVLASIDNNSHLEMLQALVAAISDDDILSKLPEVDSIAELQKLFPD